MATISRLTLPSSCSQSMQVLDRFDVLSSDAETVKFWSIVRKVLKTPVNSKIVLIDVIETLSITLHGQIRCENFNLLSRIFDVHFSDSNNFFEEIWPGVRDVALDLPELFPSGHLTALTATGPTLALSRRQVASLLVHQLLCTIPKPHWMSDGSQDFSIWYADTTPHTEAVEAYLRALFMYFEHFATEERSLGRVGFKNGNGAVTFTVRSITPENIGKTLQLNVFQADPPLQPLEVISRGEDDPMLETDLERLLGLPDGASVISANKMSGLAARQAKKRWSSVPHRKCVLSYCLRQRSRTMK